MSVIHIATKYGTVHRSTVCKDDYGNLKVYDQPPEGGSPIVLQAAALASFRECERVYARRTRPWWSKARKEAGRPIPLTGSFRSCETQRRLYDSDQDRYAHPNSGVHTQGLAIDVWNATVILAVVGPILRSHGWNQSRPDDEPWHFSYGVTA